MLLLGNYGKSPSELFYDRLVESGSLITPDFLTYLSESLAQVSPSLNITNTHMPAFVFWFLILVV